MTNYESSLSKFVETDWQDAVSALLPSIHAVDRDAVRIWFRFYPLSLHRFLQNSEDSAKDVRKFVIQGEHELAGQIDSSHRFLYGHRFWSEAKRVIEERASKDVSVDDLKNEIDAVAQLTADAAKVGKSLTTSIAAVGLMTLVQTGLDAFKAAAGKVAAVDGRLAKSPDSIVADRKVDDSQGLFGFLKTVNKTYTVTWDESDPSATFKLVSQEDLATASANDRSRDWQSKDERCWEGVVPVECRSAACGTCWVGVLGGADKLSEVKELERKRMEIFGYNRPSEGAPYMRLACQAKATGNVTIVIPPWNGVFGRKVYDVPESELLPATTSAKKLRETIKTAMSEE